MGTTLKARMRLLKGAVLAVSLLSFLPGIHLPIEGEHYFRQTHVAANIEKYISKGISLHPSTFNFDAPIAFFDFPLYEIGVASLSRILGAPSLEVSRILNLFLFALSFFACDRLMDKTRVRPLASGFTLFFFALAPLNLFYVGTPLPDTLAVSASLGSLLAFVSWDQGGSTFSFLAFVLLGVVSTIVKSPIYLPVAIAVLVYKLGTKGRTGVREPGILVWAALILASVVGFKALSNTVNQISGVLGPDEAGQYFGDLSERRDPWYWTSILRNLMKTANPLAASLGLLGGLFFAFRSRRPYFHLYLGLLLGSFLTVFIFFSRFTFHDYYHLPLVFPLAFFAGDFVDRLRPFLRESLPKWGVVGLLLLLLCTSALLSRSRLKSFSSGTKPGQTTHGLVAAGDYLQNHTAARDFIVYVIDDHENWNPAYLYFARRDGLNLQVHHVSHRSLQRIWDTHGAGYSHYFLYCPQEFLPLCGGRLKQQPTEASSLGGLFSVPEDAH